MHSKFAAAGGHGVHIHLQEIREEVTAIRLQHGMTPIAYCARTGLFETPTIAAHCVWVDAEDRETLAAHQVGVAHNPVSNMILASVLRHSCRMAVTSAIIGSNCSLMARVSASTLS